ncbi:MAG: tRNA (N(6)-L-threonylcarbamoyladenosine(37)-C(2))-methylthiotransferase MtaB [Muribaculaceae bacterium]|jgi:threonylcarbamoyladenosine tRNA methylthiotransferase MtaB
MTQRATAIFHTFGCKLNFAETATVRDIFATHGITDCPEGGVPDFIVVNSCSVTAEADRKCRSAIRNFHRRYPQAAIVLTGCYAQLKPAEASLLPGVAVVAGVNDKLALADMALDWLERRRPHTEVRPVASLREFMPSCARGDRTRFFLKVQDGCDYWCSYCTIPRARGRSRSGTIADIVAQAEAAAEAGGKEIVITGVNIGDFGAGRDDSLLDLCRELDKVEGIVRYRISSIEPNLLTDDLIDFVASSRAFMPHFHIPLQSGSDAVLALMRRRYDTALFAAKVGRIRSVLPDAFIGVDIIAGARGETPEEFERSRSFVSSLDISRLHVFPYSERPGTRALDIAGVVDQAEKHRRAAELGKVSAGKLAGFSGRFTGSVRPVLLEHSHANGHIGGFTDNYLRVSVDAPASADNSIVDVRLGAYLPESESMEASVVAR